MGSVEAGGDDLYTRQKTNGFVTTVYGGGVKRGFW